MGAPSTKRFGGRTWEGMAQLWHRRSNAKDQIIREYQKQLQQQWAAGASYGRALQKAEDHHAETR